MSAIISGNGLGLFNSSLNLLGAGSGSAALGRFGERLYINGATGNLVVQNQDELLVGLGLDAALVRTYNSQGLLNDDNGDNWRLNVASLFNIPGSPNTAGTSVSKRFGDGAEITYTYDVASGVYVSTAGDGAHDTLSYNSGSAQWTWTDGSTRVTEKYNASGQLVSSADVDGNLLTLSYSGSLLTQIADASGQVTYLDYTGSNLTQIRTVSSGVTQVLVKYTYDASNRLSQVIVDLTPADAFTLTDSNTDGLYETVNGQTYVTTYTYDGASKRIASITQGDGTAANDTSVSFTYVNASGVYKVATITDGEGKVTSLSYSTNQAQVTDPLNQVTTYTTDASGRLTQVTSPTGIVTAYGYDASGNVGSITDGNGNVVAMTYDTSGNLTLTRDALGNTVKRTYNSANQLVTETVYLVPDPDGAGAGQPGTPLTTRYAYDGENHLRFVISAEGRVTEYRYNANGTRSSAIAYSGGTYSVGGLSETTTLSESQLTTWVGTQDLTKTERSDFTYDFRGQLSTSTTYTQSNSSGVGAGTASVVHYIYDQRGQLLQTLDARNNTTPDPANSSLANATTYTYDGLGRVKSATQWVASGDTRTSLYSYDDQNRATKTTLANGLATTSSYDKRGLLVSVVQSNDATQQTLGTTGYKYDADGNLRIVTDPTGQKTYFLYDNDDRQVAAIDATGALVETTYDNAGNVARTKAYATRLNGTQLASLVDGSGNPAVGVTLASLSLQTSSDDRITRHVYNAANQVVFTIAPADAGSTLGYVTHTFYDGAGRVTAVRQYANAVTLPGSFDILSVRNAVAWANGGWIYELTSGHVYATAVAGSTPLYRVYNPGNTDRVYTTSLAVRNASIAGGWIDEGIAGYVFDTQVGGTTPLYRVANPGNGTHVFTTSLAERDGSVAGGWVDEGIAGYVVSASASDVLPFYRLANPANGIHLQTASLAERDGVALITSNGADRQTRSFYDNDGRLIGRLDAEGYLSENVYNAAGELIETIGYSAPAGVNLATSTFAQLKTSVGTGGRHEYRFYNAKGQLTGTLDADNFVTEYAYDVAGNPTQRTRYARHANSFSGTPTLAVVRPSAASNDQVVVTAYNGANQATQVTTNPAGTVTTYTYDNVGNVIRTDRAWNTGEVRTDSARYDIQGRLLQALTAEGRVALDALPGGATQTQIDAVWTNYSQTYAYDGAGRRTSVTDQNGNKTLFYYNANGQPTHTVNALGDVAQTNYNAFGETQETVRYVTRMSTSGLTGGLVSADATFTSRLAGLVDIADSHATLNYTLRGAVKSAVDALGASMQYAYNAFGNVASQSDPIGAGDASLTTYAYDRRGLLTQTIEDQGAGKLNRTTSATYDAFGRVKTTTDANGNAPVSYSYTVGNGADDRVGRVVTVADSTGSRVTAYDAFDRVLSVTDALGFATVYSYDDANRSFTVTTPEGIQTTTVANRHGETVSITDGSSKTTSYAYDKNGNLVSVTDAVGVLNYTTQNTYDRASLRLTTIDARNIPTVYTYDAANRVSTRVVASGTLNLTTSYTYDGQGRILTTTDANLVVTQTYYDKNGRVTETVLDTAPGGLNLHTTYTYDQQGRTLTVTDGAGTASARVTQYVYDHLGRRTQEIRDPGAGKLNLTTTYVYDPNDNLVAKTDGAGSAAARTTRYVYDAANRMTYAVDAAGGVTKNDYDNEGRVTRTTRYANAISLTSPTVLGNAITAANITSRLTASASLDPVTQYAYDKDGRLTFTVDALRNLTERQYDGMGRVLRQTRYANTLPANVAVTDTAIRAQLLVGGQLSDADQTTRTVYNGAGRAVFTLTPHELTASKSYVTETIYDNNGNAIRSIGYANAITTPQTITEAAIRAAATAEAEPGADHDTRSVYDNANRQRYSIDALGYVKESVYDGVGHVTQTKVFYNAVALGSLPANPTESNVLNALTNSSNDQTTNYLYDKAGRLTRTTDAKGFFESYAYNDAGDKTQFTNKLGNVWNYAYDAVGRLTDETSPQVTVTRINPTTLASTQSVESIVTHMTYDALGNVLTRTEAFGAPEARQTTYVYDVLGRQIRTVFAAVGRYNSTADVSANYVGRNETTDQPTTTTWYDTLGNAVAARDTSGNVSYKAYDNLGRLKYEIDAERYVTQYAYDAYGNQLTVKRFANRMTNTALETLPGGSVNTFTSRETAATDTYIKGFTQADLDSTVSLIASASDRTLTNLYDKRNQLTETRQPEVFNYDSTTSAYFTAQPTTRNTYNAFGQVVVQSAQRDLVVWNETYFYYNARGEKIAEVKQLGLLTTYQYDASGNLKEQREYAEAVTNRTLDGYSTPVVTTPVGVNAAHPELAVSAKGFDRITQFGYDALNRKTAETKLGVQYSTAIYGSSANATPQYGNLTTEYTYDKVGNVVAVTDPSLAVTRTYYDALGRTTATTAAARPGEDVGGTPLVLPATLPSTATTLALTVGTTTSTTWSSGWQGSNSVQLSWTTLDRFGSGDVRVSIRYTARNSAGATVSAYRDQLFTGANSLTGATVTWNASNPADGNEYAGMQSVDGVQIWKVIDGVDVLINSSDGVGKQTSVLAWEQPAVRSTDVIVKYRVLGSANTWTTTSTINDGGIRRAGNYYWLDTTALSDDLYEYTVSYRRAGEATDYATGTGTFSVVSGIDTGTGTHVVGFTEEPVLNVAGIASATWVPGYMTDPAYWSGSNSISLKWASLDEWGSGNVRAYVTYVVQQGSGGNTTTASREVTVSGLAGRTGTTISWTPTGGNPADYSHLVSVSSVQVYKVVNGQELTIFNSTNGADTFAPERLVLRGKTAGLTGVTIKNASGAVVDTRTLANGKMVSLGSGAFAVDVSDLLRGTYTFTPIGTSSIVASRFETYGSQTATGVSVQERASTLGIITSSATWVPPQPPTGGYWQGASSVGLTWSSLEQWGNGDVHVRVDYTGVSGQGTTSPMTRDVTGIKATDSMNGTMLSWTYSDPVNGGIYTGFGTVRRVQVWKTINGQEVQLFDNMVNDASNDVVVSGLATSVQNLTFQYRRAGSSDAFTTAPNVAAMKNSAGAKTGWFSVAADTIPFGAYEYQLTADGVAAGTGTFEIKHGGGGLINGTAANITPLATFAHDAFGATVRQTRMASGSTLDGNGQPTAPTAANDQTTLNVYDKLGRVVQTVDAEGTQTKMSYDAAGKLAKQWHTVVDVDNVSRQSTTLFLYDKVGHQISASNNFAAASGVTVDRNESQYNAFGEVTAKGVNGGNEEFAEYDNAGRLWRTNKDDGVTRVYYYNLSGQSTMKVESATLDLRTMTALQISTDNSGAMRRTITAFDALGRAIGQVLPSFTVQASADPIPATMSVTALSMIVAGTTSATWTVGQPGGWVGPNTLNLRWNSLEQWGSGDVTVTIAYTARKANGSTATFTRNQTFNGLTSKTGALLSWSAANAVDPNEYAGLVSVNSIQVSKTIDGSPTLLFDTGGGNYQGSVLTWQKPDVFGTEVTLSYRSARLDPNDPAAWQSITSPTQVQQRGSLYWVDLSAFANDVYEYKLSYRRTNETNSYAQGQGTFSLAVNTNALTGLNVSGFVREPVLDVASFSTSMNWTPLGPYGTGGWSGSNTVKLGWTSLDQWGTGNVRVRLTYVGRNSTNATGSVVRDFSNLLSAVTGDGTILTWGATNYASTTEYAKLVSISAIEVWKVVNGQELKLFSSANGADSLVGEQLVLRGNTSGIASVKITNLDGSVVAAARAATLLGNGIYTADVSDLASGTYLYRPQNGSGTAFGVPVRFEVKGNQPSATRVAVQENTATATIGTIFGMNWSTNIWTGTNSVALSWTPLDQWGAGNISVRLNYTAKRADGQTTTLARDFTGITATDGYRGTTLQWGATNPNSSTEYASVVSVQRAQVWKNVNGVDVLVFDSQAGFARQLMVQVLPTTVATLTVEYRVYGTNDNFVTIDPASVTAITNMAGANTGWFKVNYDAIPLGDYEYRLTARNSSGNPVDLTSLGGNASGVVSGRVELKRGAQSVIGYTQLPSFNLTPQVLQTLDRWGNILEVSDPRSGIVKTTYRYDHLNQMIYQERPLVDVVGENGVGANATPITRYAYDQNGKLIQVTDENGNVHRRWLDSAGNVTAEYRPDGTRVRHSYDTLGREIATTDGNGNTTLNVYDHNNRLVQVTDALGYVTTYQYDADGHRIKETNALSQSTKALYDVQGNLVQSRQALGQATTYTYDAFGNKLSELNAKGDTLTWTYGTTGGASSYFHRARTHKDLGNQVATYGYDYAGQLTSLTSAGPRAGQNQTFEYYVSGDLKRINDLAAHLENYYEYDAAHNKTRERVKNTTTSETYEDVTFTYDNIGRVTRIDDFLRYDQKISYDAAGNRREIKTTYTDNAGNDQVQDNWYKYDAMNRITLAQGALVSNQIVITSGGSAKGTLLAYDGAGNRTSATKYENTTLVAERYLYDAGNRLAQTYRDQGQGNVLTSNRVYDAADRMTDYTGYSAVGTLTERRLMNYNANGWLTSQANYGPSVVSQYMKTADVTYTGIDQVGNVTSYTVDAYDGSTHHYSYSYTYAAYETYLEKTATGSSPDFSSGNSTKTYDVNGHLVKVEDSNNAANFRTYVQSTDGHILQQKKGTQTQYYFYADGKPIGNVGALSAANFDYNYTPVNDRYPASTPGTYVVNGGDTLQTISQNVWGDSSLWYLIADENGLTGSSTLVAGQTLKIPNTITNVHNDHSTFQPYNPQEIIGNTTPTFGAPKFDCTTGDALTVVMAIVMAVALAYLTGGAGMPTAVQFAGLAASTSMTANAAIQGANMYAGKQENFNWESYAKTGAVAGVAAYLGQVAGGAVASYFNNSAMVTAVTSATVSSAVTQWASPEQFSWSLLAANVLMAGATQGMANQAALDAGTVPVPVASNSGTGLAGFAREIVKGYISTAVTIAFTGEGKFSFKQIAADAFGSAIGNAVVEASSPSYTDEQLVKGQAETAASQGGAGRLYEMAGAVPTSYDPSLDPLVNGYRANFQGRSAIGVYDSASDPHYTRATTPASSDLNALSKSLMPYLQREAALDPFTRYVRDNHIKFNLTGPAPEQPGLLDGVGHAAFSFVYEPLAMTYDIEQVGYEYARSLITGEAPRNINYASGLGQAAQDGAGTTDIVWGGVKGTVMTPWRLGVAISNGDSYAIGEEGTNLAAILYGGPKAASESGLTKTLGKYDVQSPVVFETALDQLNSGIPIKGVQNPLVRIEEGGLDWTRTSGRTGNTAAEHVAQNHGNLSLTKPNQGVFYGDPIAVLEGAWSVVKQENISPVTVGGRDIYVVPRANSGYAGGMGGQLNNFDFVTLITESGTNRVVTGYPSGRTPPIPKGYFGK